MRVLHVITDDDRRGAQVFADDLHSAMRTMGVESRVVALAPGRTGGIDAQVLGQGGLGPKVVARLRVLMGRHSVTIAHGSTTLPACALAGAGRRRRHVNRQISETRFWADTATKRRRVAGYHRAATLVVALADSAAAELTEVLGVPLEKIRVVPNGVPVGPFEPATAATRAIARRRFGLMDAGLVVATVSALVPEKGVDVVIDAVGRIPGARLVVAGDGPERERLEAAAARHAPNAVTFVGSLPDVTPLYQAADVVALASRGGDSMPATLIEAGLCGVATIATDVGAISDVVRDGETGVIAPLESFADELAVLAADADARTALGASARTHCLANFAIETVAQRWIEVLQTVTGPVDDT